MQSPETLCYVIYGTGDHPVEKVLRECEHTAILKKHHLPGDNSCLEIQRITSSAMQPSM